jgi:hypothetical protein
MEYRRVKDNPRPYSQTKIPVFLIASIEEKKTGAGSMPAPALSYL